MTKSFCRWWVAVLILFLGIAGSASAQGEGEDEGSSEESGEPAGSEEGGGEETPPEPEPAPPPKEEPKPAPAPAPADEPEDEELLSLEEQEEMEARIKVVQKKYFVKDLRLEISPFIGVLPQDSLVLGLAPGLRIDFFIFDSFGIELIGGGVINFDRDVLDYAKKQSWFFDESRPNWFAGLNLLWSPFYGKFAFLSDWLVNFDFFIHVGFVAVGSESINRYNPPREKGTAVHPGGTVGLGWKLFVTQWFAPRIDISYMFYMETFEDSPDAPNGKHEDPTQFRDNVLVSLGFSFFPY